MILTGVEASCLVWYSVKTSFLLAAAAAADVADSDRAAARRVENQRIVCGDFCSLPGVCPVEGEEEKEGLACCSITDQPV